MYTGKLSSYNYNINILKTIICKINLKKILFSLLLLMFGFTVITIFNIFFEYNNTENSVANFKTDINMISETASILEIERTSNKNTEINAFGSDGKLINSNELISSLSEALIPIVDLNKDGKISSEEIAELGIMRLKSDIYQKKLKEFQFNLKSFDHNLEHYIIITKGKNAGTMFYNGPFKFIDSENRQYFGLELSSNAK